MKVSAAGRNVLVSFVFITTMLYSGNGIAQTEWEKHPDNPVVNLGFQGAWDSSHIFDPVVIFHDAEYRMWYSGDDDSNNRIGYATSIDGVAWKKHPGSPVIDIGPAGAWDGVYTSNCSVIHDDAEYKMWYCGVGDHDPSNGRIGYATSLDGINWEKHSDNPIIDMGPAGTWSQDTVSKPTVIFRKGEYMMWYVGHDRGPRGKRYRIGYATSVDGIAWTQHPDNPVLDIEPADAWDSSRISGPSVLFDDTGYKMWYDGFDGSHWRIGYAVDTNGVGKFGVAPKGKLSTTWANIKRASVLQD